MRLRPLLTRKSTKTWAGTPPHDGKPIPTTQTHAASCHVQLAYPHTVSRYSRFNWWRRVLKRCLPRRGS